MGAWFIRHLQTLFGSLGDLTRRPLATVTTALVIGIALALPACLQLVVENLRTVAGDWNRAIEISVYLKKDTKEDAARSLQARIQQRRDVAEAQLILADDALKTFRERSGFGAALDALKDNPLPHTLIVRPAAQFATPAQVQELAGDLRATQGVDLVQLDTEWVNRLYAVLDAIKRGAVLAAGLLAIGVLVVVGNSVASEIQKRHDEIEVMKLVGGSDGFVRRPFLYGGFWYGLFGGLIAWLLTVVVVASLNPPVRRIAGLYGSQFELTGLGLEMTLWLLGGGAFLGWLGSLIASTRRLRAIDPR
jgi:cell division transport system permease protein